MQRGSNNLAPDFHCVLQVSQWCGLAAKEGMPIQAGVGVPRPAPGQPLWPHLSSVLVRWLPGTLLPFLSATF